MIAAASSRRRPSSPPIVYDVLSLADVVVVDVQLDYAKNELGNCRNGEVEMAALEESFEIIAEHIPPDCLVLIETTVAPGTTEQIALPAMRKIFRQRGIASEPAPRPQLRARHARPRVRGLDPRLLARLQRRQRQRQAPGS